MITSGWSWVSGPLWAPTRQPAFAFGVASRGVYRCRVYRWAAMSAITGSPAAGRVSCRIDRRTCDTGPGGGLSRIHGRPLPVLAIRRWELW